MGEGGECRRLHDDSVSEVFRQCVDSVPTVCRQRADSVAGAGGGVVPTFLPSLGVWPAGLGSECLAISEQVPS